MTFRVSYPRLLGLLCNKPIMATEDQAILVYAAIRERIGGVGLSELLPNGDLSEFSPADLDGRKQEKLNQLNIQSFDVPPYHASEIAHIYDGVMEIPVHDSLIQRGALHPQSGMTSYTGIEAKIKAGLNDPDVKALMLNIDSPGGEAAGCFDLVDIIAHANTVKPVWAIAQDDACSAAYAIGSASGKFLATQNARLGSIGVITIHLDRSGQLSKEGIKPTLITAGALKAAGNSLSALDEDARAMIQASINSTYEIFTEKVSTNRNLSVAAVKATEAGIFDTKAALEIGLVDGLMSRDQAMRCLISEVNQNRTGASAPINLNLKMEDKNMAIGKENNARLDAGEEDDKPKDEAAENGTSDENQDSQNSSKASDGDHTAAVLAERTRLSAILNSEEAKSRRVQALHLATKTDMSAVDAMSLLKVSPKEEVDGGLDDLMQANGEIDLGAGTQPPALNDEDVLLDNMKARFEKSS